MPRKDLGNVCEPSEKTEEVEFSIVMPCLNEAETLGVCIDKALKYFHENGISGEVVVADNGSDDGSRELAVHHRARLVKVARRGYGAAIMGGIHEARGRYIIMGDADDSYDFSDLSKFVIKLREGYELVMGNRFKGGIKPDAMPPLHKYLGNPVLSGIGRLFFKSGCGDFHCGLRGFDKEAINRLGLCATGMEFASEMVVKATLGGLKITEVPTTLSPDGRSRPPHLRSWRDGWRHLRFLLLFSPRWLFLYPGSVSAGLGLIIMALLSLKPLTISGVQFDVHTLLVGSLMVILGTQALTFAWLAKQYATDHGLLPRNSRFDRLRRIVTLERVVVIGGLLVVAGALGILAAFIFWGLIMGFSDLPYQKTLRIVIPSVTAMAMGFQLVMAGFLSGVLDTKLSDSN